MQQIKGKKLTPSKEVAYIAVMSALLLGGQYVLSFVAGVEIVTILLICFSYSFGMRRGAVCALSFSLLRCLLFGFYPTVIILYLIYYPLLAIVFGALGHIKQSTFKNYPWYFALIINVFLLGIAVACALCYGLDLIKISRIYKVTIYTLLWVIFALCIGLLIAFDCLLIAKKAFKKDTADALKLITFASLAAICTICFTLLDDIITPLFFGYSYTSWLAYFYTSFTAMLPQTVCTIVTVITLFFPVTALFSKIIKA